MDASTPQLQQQEEMKEVLSTGTLSGQGQCSDPCKLASNLTDCVCMCVCFHPASQYLKVDKMVGIVVICQIDLIVSECI